MTLFHLVLVTWPSDKVRRVHDCAEQIRNVQFLRKWYASWQQTKYMRSNCKGPIWLFNCFLLLRGASIDSFVTYIFLYFHSLHLLCFVVVTNIKITNIGFFAKISLHHTVSVFVFLFVFLFVLFLFLFLFCFVLFCFVWFGFVFVFVLFVCFLFSCYNLLCNKFIFQNTGAISFILHKKNSELNGVEYKICWRFSFFSFC